MKLRTVVRYKPHVKCAPAIRDWDDLHSCNEYIRYSLEGMIQNRSTYIDTLSVSIVNEEKPSC